MNCNYFGPSNSHKDKSLCNSLAIYYQVSSDMLSLSEIRHKFKQILLALDIKLPLITGGNIINLAVSVTLSLRQRVNIYFDTRLIFYRFVILIISPRIDLCNALLFLLSEKKVYT